MQDEPEKDKKDPPVTVNKYKYEFKNYNVKKKYILKIRARGSSVCTVNRSWGEWSEPIKFGKPMEYIYIYIITMFANLSLSNSYI